MHPSRKISVCMFTPQAIREIGAGDWVQASRTYEAMRSLGGAVHHVTFRDYVHLRALLFARENFDGRDLWDADVWHFIPGRLTCKGLKILCGQTRKRPLLAGSSILWVSQTHEKVILDNRDRSVLNRLKFGIKHIWRPKLKYLEAFDLILPNSQAEVAVCRRYAKLKCGSLLSPVPNGIDAIPEWADECPPPKGLSRDGYVIYPGVFSARKNQLGFIRAMRGTKHPVLFMGGPVGIPPAPQYYDRCRAEAPAHFRFLGALRHGSREFYGAMGNARVACLCSSCETPGIALLEAAALGVRPAVTSEGGAAEYLGFEAEYLNPLCPESVRNAVQRAWNRGRLDTQVAAAVRRFTWEHTARKTLEAYSLALNACALETATDEQDTAKTVSALVEEDAVETQDPFTCAGRQIPRKGSQTA